MGCLLGLGKLWATSNDLGPKWWFSKGIPTKPHYSNSCLGIIVVCPDWVNQTIQNSMVILSDSPIMHWLSWCHIK